MQILVAPPKPWPWTLSEADWQRYLVMAAQAASDSPDPSTQNGAVLIGRDRIGVLSCNRTPHGAPDLTRAEMALLTRDRKLELIEHAERNAVYNAARKGVCTDGATLFCLWYACTECARAVVASGVKLCVGSKRHLDGTPERWMPSVEAGLDILRSGGVGIEWYDGPLPGAPRLLFNGEEIGLG